MYEILNDIKMYLYGLYFINSLTLCYIPYEIPVPSLSKQSCQADGSLE